MCSNDSTLTTQRRYFAFFILLLLLMQVGFTYPMTPNRVPPAMQQDVLGPPTPVKAMLTADNVYELCFGNANQVFECVGTDNIWKTAESYEFIVNASDYIYIAAWSDKAGAQGLLAELMVGDHSILSGDPVIDVCATGHNLDYSSTPPGADHYTTELELCKKKWTAVAVGEPNGASPWGMIDGMADEARWIWYQSNNTDCAGSFPGDPDYPVDVRSLEKAVDGENGNPPFTPGCNHDEHLIFRLPVSNHAQPDLIISQVTFDKACNATFTISNVGAADVPAGLAFAYQASPLVSLNGQPVAPTMESIWHDGIPAGQVVTPVWGQMIVQGALLTVVVDSGNSITESDESNNQSTFLAPAHCQPAKLIIKKDAQPNSPVNFNFTSSVGPFTLDDPGTNDGDGFTNVITRTVAPGTITVTETVTSGWYAAAINCQQQGGSGATWSLPKPNVVTVNATGGSVVACTFVNKKTATIKAWKYHDLNADHTKQTTEPWLAKWKMLLYQGNTLLSSKLTLTTGSASFTNLIPGAYTVCEGVKAGWTHTQPIEIHPTYNLPCYSVTVAAGQGVNVNFGNHQCGITPCTLARSSTTPMTETQDFTFFDLPDVPEAEEGDDSAEEAETELSAENTLNATAETKPDVGTDETEAVVNKYKILLPLIVK